MKLPGSEFLHQRQPDFHASAEVEVVAEYLRADGERIPNDPAHKLSAYMKFLIEYVDDGLLTGNVDHIERQVESQVDSQVSPAVQEDQRHSLRSWADHLAMSKLGYAPWFRLYAFESVTKMGRFDREKGVFDKRSNSTEAPFPDLNRDAVARVYDWLVRNKLSGQTVQSVFGALGSGTFDEDREATFQKALRSGNFSRLYAHATQEQWAGYDLQADKGSWTRFPKDSADWPMYEALQGFGLSWCTTGLGTIRKHLQQGDAHVYRTRGSGGQEVVPRIAIRMTDEAVREVRGIGPHQNLEPQMVEIVASKLSHLSGGEAYAPTVEDVRRLRDLESKVMTDPEVTLTADEANFLYQIQSEIRGFGEKPDPRIGRLRRLRGDRDAESLAEVLAASILGQVDDAYLSYRAVAMDLAGRRSKDARGVIAINEFNQLLQQKDAEWRRDGVYDYVAEQRVRHDTRVVLTATPNQDVGFAQIAVAIKSFSRRQGHGRFRPGRVLRGCQYSDDDWSGYAGDDAIRFSLVGTSFDSEMGDVRPEAQIVQLRERQAARPELGLRVPSLLDTLCYWYRLRSEYGMVREDVLHGTRTGVRYINLAPDTAWRPDAYPFARVEKDGKPTLGSHVGIMGVRLAVG